MPRPSSAVKKHTSSATHRIAGVLVRVTLGFSSVLPGSSFITPVALAMASTPESASTMPTNPLQFFAMPPVSGWRLCTASPRCGTVNAPSTSTTVPVSTETITASPPVCLGPRRFSAPMPAMASAANISGCGTPRYWNAESAEMAAVTM